MNDLTKHPDWQKWVDDAIEAYNPFNSWSTNLAAVAPDIFAAGQASAQEEHAKEQGEYESTVHHLEAMSKLLATTRDIIKELETTLHVRTAELEAQLNPPKGFGWRYLQEPD